ncbi:MAG: hypothetical protein PCFJNLEI_00246 [Verrucomicrobiae bacterium]|nr:hypothetical protein [Verrucomicrobiae bacterium]
MINSTLAQLNAWTGTSSLVLEFDPAQCHVTLLGRLNADGSVKLPALMHFPDHGTLRITGSGSLGYDATRLNKPYVRVTFPAGKYRWEPVCIHPDVPGIASDRRFDGFRRNWLNIFQINPKLRVLANHAASDNCTHPFYKYADIARYTPPLADGLTALDLIRESLDRYLNGLLSYGMPGFVMFEYGGPASHEPPALDVYPSLVISACIAGEDDPAWFKRNYAGIRDWAEKILAMDADGNGLIEYSFTGNSGSWPALGKVHPSNWWDCIGFGHADAYGNALAYRALRSLAKLAPGADAPRYQAAVDKLKAVYFPTFFNPATGILAGWRSADGELHDYWFVWLNSAAIHLGLVPHEQANAIMDRLLGKMREVGFQRFDLGLPGNLVVVPQADYCSPDPRWGGAGAFQVYENGGATACFTYYTLAALYELGRREEADRILFPMLESYAQGGFSGGGTNGMTNDWKTWDGTPWGYEGFLVDNYYALLAVLRR